MYQRRKKKQIITNDGMFTVKNFRLVYVKYAFYLKKICGCNLEVNFFKLYFKMLLSRKK